MSSEAQHAEERVVDTATGAEAPAEISEERVQHIFSNIAKQYARFNAVSSFGLFKGWLRKTVDAANLTPESDLLDLAGGTGDVSYMAASRRPPAHIQLTDFVPEMLDVAREREAAGAACGVPIDFEVVDAQEIPYADNSYDAVTMAYGIRNIPDRMKALREVHRVLKPGGTFACLEFSTPPNAVWRFLYHIYLKVMIPFWGQVFTHDRPSFVYLADSIRAFPDQQHYAQMLRDAGFSDVRLEELRRRHRGCAYGTQIIDLDLAEGHALPLWSNPVRGKGISGAFCSCGIYRNRTPSDQGEAKVDLREKPARLSGLFLVDVFDSPYSAPSASKSASMETGAAPPPTKLPPNCASKRFAAAMSTRRSAWVDILRTRALP